MLPERGRSWEGRVRDLLLLLVCHYRRIVVRSAGQASDITSRAKQLAAQVMEAQVVRGMEVKTTNCVANQRLQFAESW
jgi:hypothetical protein